MKIDNYIRSENILNSYIPLMDIRVVKLTEREMIVIKEVYKNFESYLKGKTRDTWLKLIEDQSILVIDNYVVHNSYVVKNSETN